MLTVNKYKNVLKAEFYLDSDDITIRRNKDGWGKRYKQHDEVSFFKLCGHGYGGVHIPSTRTTVSRTHLLTLLRGIDLPDDCVTDHIDGDNTNDLRSNIRITTQALNCRNSKMRKNNTSGYTGISWNQKGNCYIVRKYLKGIRTYGGSSKTLVGAKQLLQALEIESLKDGYTTRHGK